MFKFFNDIRNTVRDLLTRKGRSFLTILGIIIGVAGVIIIISLGAGAQTLVLSQITNLGTNLVGVLPGKTNEKAPPAAVFGVQIKTLSVRDVRSIALPSNVPNVVAVASFVRGNATVTYGRESVDTTFTATDGSYPRVQNAEMDQGVFFTDEEGLGGANVIVLGYDIASELFPDISPIGKVVTVTVSHSDPLGLKNNVNSSIPFRVVGVQKKLGTVAFQNQDDQVFIPFVIGQRELLGIDYVQAIRAKVDDASHVQIAIDDITRVLRTNHRITNADNDDFSVRDLADAIKILTSITDVLRMFLGLMAGISLIVGGIGIMNIMLVTVSERTREIGLRKSLGATNANIRNQFLFESCILTFTGGLIGIVLGIVVSYLISMIVRSLGYNWDFVISVFSIVLSVSVSIMTGIFFGLYPSIKASRLDPIVALRYE